MRTTLLALLRSSSETRRLRIAMGKQEKRRAAERIHCLGDPGSARESDVVSPTA